MTTTHSSLVPWPCHISILVAAMDDDFLCIQQEWRKRHIMPQVQWEDSLHFISTLKVSLCSRTEKFRYGQWAFQNTCLDSKKWMIVGVPYHPVKEWGRAFPILSSPFQSNLSRQIEIRECGVCDRNPPCLALVSYEFQPAHRRIPESQPKSCWRSSFRGGCGSFG